MQKKTPKLSGPGLAKIVSEITESKTSRFNAWRVNIKPKLNIKYSKTHLLFPKMDNVNMFFNV